MVRPVDPIPGALTFTNDNVSAGRPTKKNQEPTPVTFQPPQPPRSGWMGERVADTQQTPTDIRRKVSSSTVPNALDLDSPDIIARKRQLAYDTAIKARQPEPVFDIPIKEKNQIKTAVEYANKKYSGMLSTYPERIDRQVSQIIPLSINVVMHWGSNTIDELSKLTVVVSKLARDFSQCSGTELSQEVLNAMKQSTDTSFFAKFSKPSKTVTTFVPRLKVLQTQMEQWIPQCELLMSNIIKTQQELNIKLVSLVSVVDTQGPIADNSLDIACTNRRVLCQQSIQQSEMLIIQLKQLATEMVDIAGRVDQLVQITIPAFLNASSNS